MKLFDRILNNSQSKTVDAPDEDPEKYPKYSSTDVETQKKFDIDTIRITFKDGDMVEKQGLVRDYGSVLEVCELNNFGIDTKLAVIEEIFVDFDQKTIFSTKDEDVKYVEVVDSHELVVDASANLNFKKESEDEYRKLNSVTQKNIEKKLVSKSGEK